MKDIINIKIENMSFNTYRNQLSIHLEGKETSSINTKCGKHAVGESPNWDNDNIFARSEDEKTNNYFLGILLCISYIYII